MIICINLNYEVNKFKFYTNNLLTFFMIALTKIWLRMCIFNFLTVILKIIFRYWTSRYSRILGLLIYISIIKYMQIL